MFQKLLEKIAQELLNQRIPYMVIGGQAVLVYGEPRLTKDIDITLGIGIEELDRIENLVEKTALKPLIDNIGEMVKKTMVFPVEDRESGIRVDFIFSFSPYERQAIERAIEIKIGRTEVKFAALEDLVIHKIIAGRARDMEDIKSVLLKNPNYDDLYIEKWLGKFDKSLNENFIEKFKTLVRQM